MATRTTRIALTLELTKTALTPGLLRATHREDTFGTQQIRSDSTYILRMIRTLKHD